MIRMAAMLMVNRVPGVVMTKLLSS